MIRYVDHNGVTWLVSPTAIVAVVLNRQQASSAWEATFNLINGTKFKLVDRDADQLIGRIQGAEAAADTTALGYVKELRNHKLYVSDSGQLGCNEDGCVTDGWLDLPCRRVRLRDVVAAIAIHRRECHPAAVTT